MSDDKIEPSVGIGMAAIGGLGLFGLLGSLSRRPDHASELAKLYDVSETKVRAVLLDYEKRTVKDSELRDQQARDIWVAHMAYVRRALKRDEKRAKAAVAMQERSTIALESIANALSAGRAESK